MTMKITKEALVKMEEALAANQDDTNPFVRDGETTFMRHDEVRMVQQSPYMMAVEFRWRGMLTYTMHVGCDFAAGETLTITGIDGRMAVHAEG